MERRWCERKFIQGEAWLHFPDTEEKGMLKNVSLEGAFVEMDHPAARVEEGENCEVEIIINEEGDKCTVKATVTHQEERGLGLAFQYQGGEDFRKIRDAWMLEDNPAVSV